MLALTLCAMPLAGCVTNGTTTDVETICGPWHPIKYNSKNRDSNRFAGKALVTDLRAHNFTGDRLHCKAWAVK
jgi:hypothetical protein